MEKQDDIAVPRASLDGEDLEGWAGGGGGVGLEELAPAMVLAEVIREGQEPGAAVGGGGGGGREEEGEEGDDDGEVSPEGEGGGGAAVVVLGRRNGVGHGRRRRREWLFGGLRALDFGDGVLHGG